MIPPTGALETLRRTQRANRRHNTDPGGVGCWEGSVDDKSLRLLKAMREQLGEITGRAVDAGAAAKKVEGAPKRDVRNRWRDRLPSPTTVREELRDATGGPHTGRRKCTCRYTARVGVGADCGSFYWWRSASH